MTREEAIDYAKSELDAAYKRAEKIGHKGKTRYIEALEMAIKALENHDTFMKYAYSQGKHDALSQEPTSEMVHVETLRQVMWERDIAIEQLHELGYEWGQKIELCEDAVSREDAIKALQKVACYSAAIRARMIGAIEDLPSVTQKSDEQLYKNGFADGYEQGHKDAEQKSGKWIGIDEKPHEDYECSCCGYVVSTFTANIEPHTEYKYCPNCGAKMESEVRNDNK